MCSKHYKCVRLFRFIMKHLFKVFIAVLKRFSKVTIYQLLWTAVFTLVLFVILRRPCDIDSTVNKSDGNPLILWWKSGFPGTTETRYCSNSAMCHVSANVSISDMHTVDAFLFYASNIDFNDLPLPRRPSDIIWGLYHEESPRNVEVLMHGEALSLFNFSSTFSRYSDVPFPLQHLESKEDITSKKYFISTEQKNIHLTYISPVMYLQTDCETSTERDNYVKELMKYISVDSYGTCLKNKELPEKFKEDYLNNLNEDNFLKFISRYKFVVAIENGVCHDYVTEKFWRAIKVGTVPIYFGSPTVKDWYPNEKSAILLNDFPTPKLMAGHLMKLMSNDTLYDEYVEHKTKEIITNQRLLKELSEREYQSNALKIVEEFECFICEKVHSIKGRREIAGNVVSPSHYNCPKPISALTLNVNPTNFWVSSWLSAKFTAKDLYKRIMSS